LTYFASHHGLAFFQHQFKMAPICMWIAETLTSVFENVNVT